MTDLTFSALRSANTLRLEGWHGETDNWTGADWSNAMCGEAGETANIVKKLRRIECATPGSNDPPKEMLLDMLAQEIADTVIYLDLLASYYGIDMGESVVNKFNAVSRREGFPQRLP